MKIDAYSPYQIKMPAAEAVAPVNRADPKPNVIPKNSLESLKNIYSDKELKKLGIVECQACSERRYVDQSDDPSVSFQTPTKISPEASASAVMAHEMEHVVNERADAEKEGREIVSQSVKLHAAICPECGVSYIAGGVTETVTKNKSKYDIPDELVKGLKVDNKV